MPPTNHGVNQPTKQRGCPSRKRTSDDVLVEEEATRTETIQEPVPVRSAEMENRYRNRQRRACASNMNLGGFFAEEVDEAAGDKQEDKQEDYEDDGATDKAIALGIQLYQNEGNMKAIEEIQNIELNARSSLIRTIKDATTKATKADVIRTGGVGLDLSSSFFVKALESRAKKFSCKEKLEIIFSLLDLESKELFFFRKDGYKGEELQDHNARRFRRVQSVHKIVLDALDQTLCSDNNLPLLFRSSIVDRYSVQKNTSEVTELKSLKNLENNILDLSVTGHRHTSAVASALLTGSFTSVIVKDKVQARVKFLLDKKITVAARRQTFGRYRFTTCKSNFEILQRGEEQ